MIFAPTEIQLSHLADMEAVTDQLESYVEIGINPLKLIYLGCTNELFTVKSIFEYLIEETSHLISIICYKSCASSIAEPFYSCRLLINDLDTNLTHAYIVSWYLGDYTEAEAEEALQGLKEKLYNQYPHKLRRNTLQQAKLGVLA